MSLSANGRAILMPVALAFLLGVPMAGTVHDGTGSLPLAIASLVGLLAVVGLVSWLSFRLWLTSKDD